MKSTGTAQFRANDRSLNADGDTTIGLPVSTCSVQSFAFNRTKAYAVGQGSKNM